MFEVGEVVSYKQQICKIKNIKKNDINGKEYYVMSPVNDESLSINTPVSNELNHIKKIMSRDEAEELIKKIPSIDVIVSDEKNIELIYKELLRSGLKEDLIRIIKTAYIRNDNRINNNKKISERDRNYLNKAEDLLYLELSYSLSMSMDEVKSYIFDYCKENIK